MKSPEVLPATPKAPAAVADDLSDGSLVRRYQEGSQAAATELYRRYAQRLYALAKAQCSSQLARRLDPEDLVQSVFAAFFRKVGQGVYRAPPGEELWGLFLVIALNKIRTKGTFYAAAKRSWQRTHGSEELEWFVEDKNHDQIGCTFLQLVVEEAVEQLPPLHGDMVKLRIEGFEVAEIAERTGRSKRTVERVLQEFRKKLDGILHDDP